MPATVDWYDFKHTIIYQRFIGDWTQDELIESSAEVDRLCTQKGERFDVIADFTDAAYTPPVGILGQWKEIAIERDVALPNWGLTIRIIKSGVLEAFFEEGVQTLDAIRKHYRLARTVEQAIQIIQKNRQAAV